MFKILAILASIILIVGVVLWWWKPKVFNLDLKSVSNILGKTKSQDNNLFTQRDLLKQTSQNTLNNLIDTTKDSLYENAKSALDTVFNKPSPEAAVEVSVITNQRSATTNTFTFDFSKDNNLQLKMSKNSKYQLKFQNTPSNYCLYIGEDKYEISDIKGVEVQFLTSGQFAIKANLCNLGDKTIGQVIVE